MQMLYAASRNEGMSQDELVKNYRNSVDRSFQLYLFNLLYLIRVAEYARIDEERRKAKLLPSEEDRKFIPRLAENEVVEGLIGNEGFQNLLKKYHLKSWIDKDTVRLLYDAFAGGSDYQDYLDLENPGRADHVDILLNLYKHIGNQEIFEETMEDHFAQWVDDQSLVSGAVKKTLKALRAHDDPAFYEPHQPAADTVEEFGTELLRKAYQEDADLLDIIEPTLTNWDVDRVAAIDMILLKMALCELLHFPTIPAKVTLNEFVEISKRYSTEKSKDFINGILDRLMKKLENEGKIQKKGRGLKD